MAESDPPDPLDDPIDTDDEDEDDGEVKTEINEAELTEEDRARLEAGQSLAEIRKEEEEDRVASQQSQEEVEKSLDYADPEEVTITDLDRIERFDEGQERYLIGVARVALPVGHDEPFDYTHRLARPAGPADSSVKRLHGVMKLVGLRRRRYLVCLASNEDNIANLDEIQGNRLDSSKPETLTKLIRFKHNRRVLCVNGATRILAVKMYYSGERKTVGLEHPWVYAAVYRKRLRLTYRISEELLHLKNVSLYESLASNITPVHAEPNAEHIWTIARGYLQDETYTEQDRRVLARAAVAKFPGCLSALMDDDFAVLVPRLFKIPGWKSLRSLRLITQMWASEGRDITITLRLARETLYREIFDWKTMLVHTESIVEWIKELREYELKPDRNVGDFSFAPTMDLNARTTHNLCLLYDPVDIDVIPFGLHIPTNSLRYGKQFVERFDQFYEQFPFALWLTPRNVPLIAKEINSFANVYKEFGRWECPQYPAVSSGTKVKGEGNRPQAFAMLWATRRTNDLFEEYVVYFSDSWNPFHHQNIMRDMRRQQEYVMFQLHAGAINSASQLPIRKRELREELLPWLRYKVHGDADPTWKALRATAVPETDLTRKYWPVIDQGLFFQSPGWMQNFSAGFATALDRRVQTILTAHSTAEAYFHDLMKFKGWYDARFQYENWSFRNDPSPSKLTTFESYKLPKKFNKKSALTVPGGFIATGDELHEFEKLPAHLEGTRQGRIRAVMEAIETHVIPLFTTEPDKASAQAIFLQVCA
ncbi:hypothetical protein CALVIDRAFT_526524 [Calocera viscosa TUFC12733]|uniref:Uncharacterized protein n=1 Tax=Calocera viscosa (strain TUFC12733) TaxID=1330018 RepID=A0A167NJB0_CALVF|nr:hypothetical protein CALVIDRAFT_526524 [Calocera viscosa TUFC12733]